MGQIHVLDDVLINKIAAGEVVERPASVVKELVENAIDAGSQKITVEIVEGGKKLISVSDNGSGMSPDDAEKALLRHATSKIKNVEDLFSLHTMGFRGEALASISSVCRFTMMTSEHHTSQGVRLRTEGGSHFERSAWNSSGGTTIICEDLFFNIPVRQKFLKSAQHEYLLVLELIQALALAHPRIAFTFMNNGKEVFNATNPGGKLSSLNDNFEAVLRSRFAHVMRDDSKLSMVYIHAQGDYGSVQGLISAPGIEKNSTKDLFLFVNGRWVKDKSLRFAVLRGYHSHLLKGKYPVTALFVQVDPGLVDVNVHPAKTEVRLQYSQEIHAMIASAVRDGIRKAEWASPAGSESRTDQHPDVFRPSDEGKASSGWLGASQSSNWNLAGNVTPSSKWRDVTPRYSQAEFDDLATPIPSAHKSFMEVSNSSLTGLLDVQLAPNRTDHIEAIVAKSVPWSELNFLGSISDCYLLFSHGNRKTGARMLVVDQHAFHERVIYERLIRNSEMLRSSQALLVPEAVELDPQDIIALGELKLTLEDHGFRFQIISENTIEVLSVPVLLKAAELVHVFSQLARSSDSAMPIDGNVGLTHDMLATVACHSAVRAGEPLGPSEIKNLIAEADGVDFYHNCPHGRRVFRWWDESQIARWFDR